ncbi:putative regulatory protein [Parvularcula bermudensis HTCC2503]|uniref:Putative regulatory protein n=2 Tax=Parvularcula TaxID=208215 RepID=E0TG71_PARBH|nr:putative regulatory protein [Parvularcula bermudensis HTCC2503]
MIPLHTDTIAYHSRLPRKPSSPRALESSVAALAESPFAPKGDPDYPWGRDWIDLTAGGKKAAAKGDLMADKAPSAPPPDTDDLLSSFERLSMVAAEVEAALNEVVFGQEDVVREVLTTVLAGGHSLLVGAPGLAKTRLVSAMGTILGLDHARVQFTPDLMPADILGTEILEEDGTGRRAFRFIEGPVFTQLLMADEINRASPRTQSALLEAMQERQVTVAGAPRALPSPFLVLATQNPIEQEGTYPLPEAQLDRFLLQTLIGYPDAEAEKRMIAATTRNEDLSPSSVTSPDTLKEVQRLVRAMPLGENLVSEILSLVNALRPGGEQADHLLWGPGPRASQALSLAVRARALIDRRPAPGLEDLIALAPAALRHRIALTFAARAEGLTVDRLISTLTDRL